MFCSCIFAVRTHHTGMENENEKYSVTSETAWYFEKFSNSIRSSAMQLKWNSFLLPQFAIQIFHSIYFDIRSKQSNSAMRDRVHWADKQHCPYFQLQWKMHKKRTIHANAMCARSLQALCMLLVFYYHNLNAQSKRYGSTITSKTNFDCKPYQIATTTNFTRSNNVHMSVRSIRTIFSRTRFGCIAERITESSLILI